MEKVILTQEQADAVDWLERSSTLEGHVRLIFFNNELIKGPKSNILKEMGFYRVMRAIFQGYKIKKHFEVGDWAKDSKGRLFKITEDRVHTANNDPRYKELRKATKEEIEKHWWAKHGREVWELKEGDVCINKSEIKDVFIFLKDEGSRVKVLSLMLEGITRIDKVSLDKHFRVLCFSEDRKDI